jgi:O-antigen/teichoic acid export membrane protein
VASTHQGDSIKRNTVFALAAQGASALFTAGLTIFLVRRLGPSEFGVFALAFGIGTLLVLPADFGLSQATARFLAERRSDRRAAAAVLAGGFRLKLVASILVAAALFALAGPIAAAYGTPRLAWPLRGMALALLGHSTMMLYSNAFVALGRIAVNFKTVLSESAIETGASIGLVLLGGGAAGAAFGRAIGYGCGALIALALAARLLGPGTLRLRGDVGDEGDVGRRRLAGYAGALFIVDTAYTALGQIDVLLIGALLSTTSVGLFQAPWRLSVPLHYPGMALALSIAPRMARRPESGGEPRGLDEFVRGMRLLLLFQLPVAIAMLVLAAPAADLVLGPGYGHSAAVLRALAPFVFLSGFAPLVSITVDYLGEARRRIPIAIATLAVNGAFDLVFIPKIGVVAGAIGSTIGYLVYVPGHLWLCRRLLGFSLRELFAAVLLGKKMSHA